MASRWREFFWKKGNDWGGFLHRVAGRGANEGNLELYVAWGRVAITSCALGCVGYLAAASGAWYYMHHKRGYASIHWIDVAWPGNWTEMRHKQGNELIESVEAHFAAQRYQQGIFSLIAGVRLAPDNLAGRTLLATIQKELGRRDLSAVTLEEGWEHAQGNLDYIGAVLQTHIQLQQEAQVVRLARDWFARGHPSSEIDAVVSFAWASALGNMRRPDEALEVVKAYNLDQTEPGVVLVAQILWGNDRRADAVAYMEDALMRHPNSDILQVRLATFQREMGRLSDAELTLVGRALAAPDQFPPQIDLAWWYYERGKKADFERAVTNLLTRFPADENALATLATGASARGLVDVVDRCRDQAKQLGLKSPLFEMCRIEALVSSKRYSEAAKDIDLIQRMKPSWLPTFAVGLTSFGAVANLAGGNAPAGESMLTSLLTQQHATAPELTIIANRFRQADLPRQAKRVLQRALQIDPSNHLALTYLIEIEVSERNTDAVPEIVDRLLARARPSMGNLERVLNALRSDYATYVDGRNVMLQRIANRRDDLLKPQPFVEDGDAKSKG